MGEKLVALAQNDQFMRGVGILLTAFFIFWSASRKRWYH